MSFLDKLLGRTPRLPAPTPTPEGAPATIKVFDAYGRQLEIPREEWRTRVLPDQFTKCRNDADALSALIVQALEDGFLEEALGPAGRLVEIDPQPTRAATMLGVTLLQLKRPAEAKKVLDEAIRKHGEEGVLLTNLAKAHSALGDQASADATLWHGLQLDPNQDNALLWYAAMARDKDATGGWSRALTRAATVPGSWRPQVWLAREALERKDVPAAIALYEQVLQRHPAPGGDVLMQISGDLGKNGQIQASVDLVAPRFDPKVHGLQVGNNLIKAYFDLGNMPAARRVLEQLYVLHRPDWQQHLVYWEGELDKAEKKYGPLPEGEKLEIGLLKIEDPVWSREDLGLSNLVVKKDASAPNLIFVCGSVDKEHIGSEVESQPADTLGRLTRAVPLYLAEQIDQQTSARTSTLIPWMKRGGFVVAAREWDLETLGQLKQEPGHVALLHIDARAASWKARVKVLRCADGAVVGSCESAIDPNGAPDGILELERQVLSVAQGQLGVIRRVPVPGLEAPRDGALPYLLVEMEQALAVACAGMDGVPAEFLYAERSIIDGMIHNCATWPESARFRLVLLGTLSREFKRRPDVAREYRDKLHELQRQHPVGGECGATIAKASEILGRQLEGAPG